MKDADSPIRIVIANHSNHSQNVSIETSRPLWIVSPRDYRVAAPSYHIEIDNAYPRIDGKSYSRIRNVVYVEGDRKVFFDDMRFEQMVTDYIEHEVFVPAGMSWKDAQNAACGDDDCGASKGVRELTRDEAANALNRQGYYSYSEAKLYNVDIDIFRALERAWEAANQFVDFAITL